jgi:protein-S-isoprenylcysteine O-methyltransferase Ste14
VRSNIIRRAVSVYDNLPLPAGSAAGVVAVFVLERARPAPLPGSRTLQRAAGVALLAAGCALNAWALVERRRRTSGEFQLEEPETIVTTGPYAVSRHPMYLGWWLIHSGAGLLRGSAWVAATLAVAVVAEHLGGALVEERDLRRRFGAEYAQYAARVPRYAGLPRRGAALGRVTAASAVASRPAPRHPPPGARPAAAGRAA